MAIKIVSSLMQRLVTQFMHTTKVFLLPLIGRGLKTGGNKQARGAVKAGALILAEIERLDRAAGIKVEAE